MARDRITKAVFVLMFIVITAISLIPVFADYKLITSDLQWFIENKVMPAVQQLVVCYGTMVFAFSKFAKAEKTTALFQTNMASNLQLNNEELHTLIATLKNEVTELYGKANEMIEALPITKIEQDLAQNTNDTTANAKALVTFKEMFKVFLTVMQKQTESQIIGKEEKENLYKIFDSAQQMLAEISQADEWKSVEHQVKEVNCDEQKI